MKRGAQFKPLTIFLLFASLGIWVVIGHRIYESLERPGEHELTGIGVKKDASVTKLLKMSASEFRSRNITLRDPFRPLARKKAQRSVNGKPTVRKEAFAPEITYVGFVDGSAGRLAIIDSGERGARLCSVGDTAFSIKVVKIEPDRLIVTQKERGRSIALQLFQEE